MQDLIKNIRIDQYDYQLAEDKIAKYPAEPRHNSKLLAFTKGEIKEDIYLNLDQYLPEDSWLIFNQTKVIQSRLHFKKDKRTTIEVFCLEPLPEQDITQAMQSPSPIKYRCLIGGARKWKSGELSLRTDSGTELKVKKITSLGGDFIVHFSWDSDQRFSEILEDAGKTPLPPYIKRPAEATDINRYQTVYAKTDGSVAAPTAGLHFSDELMAKLQTNQVSTGFLTLHVGAGTFKPVTSANIGAHDMHAEEFFPELDFLESLRENLHKKVIAVGTTSLRALESIYWLGVKILHNPKLKELKVGQWDPYQHYELPTVAVAITALIEYMRENNEAFLKAQTSLIIAPGYVHQVCRGLFTNFHQPRSTLLLLVASIVGEDWKRVYHYALNHDFRFLSYGDGCLLLKD